MWALGRPLLIKRVEFGLIYKFSLYNAVLMNHLN